MRSVSTTGPDAATWWSSAEKLIRRRSMSRSIRPTRRPPRIVGKPVLRHSTSSASSSAAAAASLSMSSSKKRRTTASGWSIYFLADRRYWRADSGAKTATMATAHSRV